jgi:hypothetical protein
MPEGYKIIDDKKFMWDAKIHDTENEAKDIALNYEKDNFETRVVLEEGKFLVYNRRVVTQVVIGEQK